MIPPRGEPAHIQRHDLLRADTNAKLASLAILVRDFDPAFGRHGFSFTRSKTGFGRFGCQLYYVAWARDGEVQCVMSRAYENPMAVRMVFAAGAQQGGHLRVRRLDLCPWWQRGPEDLVH